ncbi:MAG: hypothetical protein EP330_24240 [Deltaproteobacteria bacterium]|nr:MAG: hypothetical protein EP330_24240 [Deltaproteobacteria bacterium]
MLSLLLATALAASPYADKNADVVASATVPAPPAAVHAALEDLKTFQAILPCSSDWNFGSVTSGQGASVELTYDVGSMHRRLTAVISKTEAPRVVDYDHAGNKGFITRWRIEEADGGSQVEVTTYLNPPPWPFRKMYFTRIHPQWVTCYDEALAKLPEHVTVAAAPEAPVEEPAESPAEEPAGSPAEEPAAEDAPAEAAP